MEMISSQFIKCYFRKIELSSYYTNLKIKSTGNIKILSENYRGEAPDIITINNENYTMDKIDTANNLENNIINITLIWNNYITSTSFMFYGCDDIIEMDLSHFDTSNVENMEYMFYGCSSLTSLDLSNFDTSSVIDMEGIFERCSSLTSLDLSNFNTSIVTNMNGMFNNCEKLEYINLKSASINPNIISSNISFNLSSKLTICSENEEWSEIFNISNTTYVNCINNMSYYDIYEKRDKMKCFKNNIMELYNPCKFCGNNYFTKSLIKNNITNMNCYEYKEGNFLSLINISNLVGKEEILFGNSKSIIISSTKNKENENKNISINLGQCENILKNASNISTDEPLYIIQIISDKEAKSPI